MTLAFPGFLHFYFCVFLPALEMRMYLNVCELPELKLHGCQFYGEFISFQEKQYCQNSFALLLKKRSILKIMCVHQQVAICFLLQ